MAKARAILKRRKSVRNIRKITKTMQMIATAKFQKSLKRAIGIKPYTLKVGELVRELASSVGDIEHPLLRRPTENDSCNRIALVVLTSNRGLAGAYNGNVLRAASKFINEQEAAGKTIELYVAGKKGISFFNFQKRPLAGRYDQFADQPRYANAEIVANYFMERFVSKQVDSVHVAYMNFISTSVQKAEVMTFLPLVGVKATVEHIELQVHEGESQTEAGIADMQRTGPSAPSRSTALHAEAMYDFSPSPKELMDELLPLTVKMAFFQCFLDAVTSENVARMVSMKSATDNADKMVKSLTMRYNRARQSQITTELSEIMGGVEAMKG
ncbi:MAG TPA: ATP synthase F1 subunit gamma [Tepidisphaeraceae bacterium]|nr:ATP synthase F1 subunit gamma [Tepidisphaeraceae bacterium]